MGTTHGDGLKERHGRERNGLYTLSGKRMLKIDCRYVGVLVGLAAAWPTLFSPLVDDVYIHARIVDMYSHGLGFVYNSGQVYKASSSTGFVLVLTAISAWTGDVVHSVRLVEFVVVFATIQIYCWYCHVAGVRWQTSLVGWSVLPYVLVAAYLGMETPIVCLLLMAGVLAQHLRLYGVLVGVFALTVLFRLEALVLVALFVVYGIVNNLSLRYRLGILLLTASIFVVDWALFGGFIPQGLLVKPLVYNFPLMDSFRNALAFGHGGWGVLAGGPFLILFMLRLVLWLKYPNKMIDFWAVYFAFSFAIYCGWLFGRTIIFEWYYCLLTFPFMLYVLLEGMSSMPSEVFRVRRLSIVVLAMFFVMGSMDLVGIFIVRNNPLNRVARYLQIGTVLYDVCPTCSLATSETGAVGYSFKGTIHDAFGLGDPEAVRYHPLDVPRQRVDYSIGAIAPKYVMDKEPDFIVTMPTFSAALRASQAVAAYHGYDCRFDRSQGTVWGNVKIEVYSKEELPDVALAAMDCSKAPPR